MRKLAGLVSLALGFEPGAAGAMVELSRVQFYAGVRDVEIVGDLAYTTSGEGLHVIDGSVPAHPVVLGGLDIAQPEGLGVGPGRALVGTLRGLVLDVSDPGSPLRVASLRGNTSPGRLVLARNRAYVADGNLGTRIIDISDPTRPVQIAATKPPSIGGLALYGGLVFGAGSDAGIWVIDFGPELALPLEVPIDVQPGFPLNLVNPLRPRMLVSVALLGSPLVAAEEVDSDSLAFGPAGAPPQTPSISRDVNGDHAQDLVQPFRVSETGIALGDVSACLTGRTREGALFEGCDAIRTTPACGLGFELPLPILVISAVRGPRRSAAPRLQ